MGLPSTRGSKGWWWRLETGDTKGDGASMIDDPHTNLIILQFHIPISKRPTTFVGTRSLVDLV